MKKSLYLTLTAFLGVLLFLILYQVVLFLITVLFFGNATLSGASNSVGFWLLECFFMTLVIVGGLWYGVWLGLYWFEKVYVDKTHPGMVGHVAQYVWPMPVKWDKGVTGQLLAATKKLETDLEKLEQAAGASVKIAIPAPQPIKRTLVRKRAPKKLNGIKARTRTSKTTVSA